MCWKLLWATLKRNNRVILVREYGVSRCEYGFHSWNLLQLQLQVQKKLNSGLVLLKFAFDYLYKFLQEYDKWLFGFCSLNSLMLKCNLNILLWTPG